MPQPRTVLVPIVDEDGKTILEKTRIAQGLDTTALARVAGISRDALWRYEQPGKFSRRPRPATARRIADALGVEISTLFAQVST
jgi:transcriptional regulator with XRE-family HTH domain